jgi:hypothetical protein
MGLSTRLLEKWGRGKALARARQIMYNITHARRPTYRGSQADAGGRAPSRSSDACSRGTCEARGRWLVGGASKVPGRMDQVLVSQVRATGTASHERGARDLRPSLRRVRIQAAAAQTASAMTRQQLALTSTERNLSTTGLPPLLGLTFRRLPSVASGKPQDGDSTVFNRAGSTLAAACFGPENGVHPRWLSHIRTTSMTSNIVTSRNAMYSSCPVGRRSHSR